ncbi:MAG: membrane protein insertase YidC [Desulfobacterota bacterium]|nr:membrane protein insertase YidC [Thermodesulfobacteriota bacterium]
MDNEKRIFLAILLSIIVLYLYQVLFLPPAQKRRTSPAPPQQPPAAVVAEQPAPPLPAPDIAPADTHTAQPGIDRDITVAGTLFEARFSASAAGPRSFQLCRYYEAIEPPALIRIIKKTFGSAVQPNPRANKSKEVLPLLPGQASVFRTLFVGSDAVVHGDGMWETAGSDIRLAPSAPAADLIFSQNDPAGIRLIKKYTFREGQYKIDCELTVSNTGTGPLTGSPVFVWTAPVPSINGGGMFSGPAAPIEFAYHINGNVAKKDVTKIKEPITIEGDILWAAIEEKYFTAAVLPVTERPAQIRLMRHGANGVAYQMAYAGVTLQPGQSRSYQFSLYCGPKDIDILRQQGAELEKAVVFGWFDVIARPLLVSLKFFHRYLGNYGLAIILVTIIIKILFWPLTHKSFSAMKEMQKLQPELALLKEKYKDNKEEFARQQLALYKKYKVNPLSGCLPTLIQIPVFIALYNALMYSIELRHAPFISFWINDLSAKDPTYIAPLVMGLSMFIQQKMTPTTADPAQAKMMLFMPVIFTIMFLNFPSGLVIYWLVNNLISIAQQVYINRKLAETGGTPVCTPSKLKQNPSKKRLR